ncbi:dual specificity protein phosphatase 12 isoform X4 [Heliangelus exortis]|uniref:dual specificity protein phosphatase 12 isoform X4 n=1 Tax=Heliangelus exortis TaxID=472823 RepID=UPI003A8DA2C7
MQVIAQLLPGRGEPQRGRGDRLPDEDEGTRLGGCLRCCQGFQTRRRVGLHPFPPHAVPRLPGAPSAPLSSRPCRRMNPGFLGQLKLYEAMGCAVDSTSALYKRYRLQVLTEKYPAYLMEPVSGQVTAKKVTSACHGGGRGAALPCPTEMQCGCIDLIHNLVLTPLQNFKTCPEKSLLLIQPVYVKLQTQRFSTGAGNAEPVQWMEPALLGVMEGQLLCPKCTSKLGSFSWRGEQCSCGRWVTPAFQIHKSRVDEVRMLPVGNFQAAMT